MSRQTTLGRFGFKKCISHRNTVMETKAPEFVSTMFREKKIYTVKLKTYNCTIFTDFQHKIISLLFQPRVHS